MKKNNYKKTIVIGIIILFIGISIVPSAVESIPSIEESIPSTVENIPSSLENSSNNSEGSIWIKAFIHCNIWYLESETVTWNFAFPMFSVNKRFVFGFFFSGSQGQGTIEITPVGQPMQRYDFPEDFHRLEILFFRTNLLGWFSYNPGWKLVFSGMGILVSVD